MRVHEHPRKTVALSCGCVQCWRADWNGLYRWIGTSKCDGVNHKRQHVTILLGTLAPDEEPTSRGRGPLGGGYARA